MKHLTLATFLLLFVALLVLGGCAEERTLISRRYVVDGMEQPSDGGRSSAGGSATRTERIKYREHWWQFWRPSMPDDMRIAREERIRQSARN